MRRFEQFGLLSMRCCYFLKFSLGNPSRLGLSSQLCSVLCFHCGYWLADMIQGVIRVLPCSPLPFVLSDTIKLVTSHIRISFTNFYKLSPAPTQSTKELIRGWKKLITYGTTVLPAKLLSYQLARTLARVLSTSLNIWT